MNYEGQVESKDSVTWKVILINKDNGKPFTWVLVNKSEYPTKEEALKYLINQYESEKNMSGKEISEKHEREKSIREVNKFTYRKNKSVKSKSKRKCRCKK
jgi:hypothetical protein